MYTVKLVKPNGEEELHPAHHVVLNRKEGHIEICNPGKPSTVLSVPADADIVYVISDDSRKSVATLRAPSSFASADAESEAIKEGAMRIHTTRAPSWSRELSREPSPDMKAVISDEPPNSHDAERLERLEARHAETNSSDNQGEETTTHA